MPDGSYPVFEPDHNRKFRGIPMNKDASNHSIEIFADMLKNSGLSPDVAEEVKEQIRDANSNDRSNVVFVFTEGENAVTVVHAPASALNGQDGPVLTRGSNDRHVIAAYSAEYIRAKLESIAPKGAGLHLQMTESRWVDELEKIAEDVRFEMQINPPVNWATDIDLGQIGDL